jgi:hypothetical protein
MRNGPTPAVTLRMSKMLRVSALATAFVCLAGAGQAETLKAHYALSLMGISIGNAYASGVLDRNYRIDISMRTTGLANLVNNTKGAATASGGMTAAGPSPAAYANTTTNEEDVRTVRMSLASNAVRAVEVKPEPWDSDQRIPVTDGNKKRVVDPVSALIMTVPQGQELTGPAACNRTIAVFDGVTRFDVALSYAGERSASTAGYSGPVAVCSARYTPISGHRPDSKSTRYMAENRDMNVWLAPLPEAHVVVPIHIDVKTGAGDLVIEASDFQIGAKRADTRR